MENEVWKKYDENSRSEYYVSDYGNFKRFIKPLNEFEYIKPSLSENGYLKLWSNWCHRIVAMN